MTDPTHAATAAPEPELLDALYDAFAAIVVAQAAFASGDADVQRASALLNSATRVRVGALLRKYGRPEAS